MRHDSIIRRKTKVVNLGGVKIGFGYPVSIQSMTKVSTHKVNDCIRQIDSLKEAGCDIVRIAVKDTKDLDAITKIHRHCGLPIEADIHFNWHLAMRVLKDGIDGIRLNPGNIYKLEHLRPIVRLAKKKRIPIRVGVNSGSLVPQRLLTRGSRFSVLGSRSQAELMVKIALNYIKILEKMDFCDIIISIKSSDVHETVKAYKLIASKCNYPLHLGVTAAGFGELAVIKSSIGIGSLLVDGIGDTIRVSLTDDPVREVIVAKDILNALGLRKQPIEIISCPTCGRCQVDLVKIVKEVEKKLFSPHKMANPPRFVAETVNSQPVRVAIMGCEVNGPGEAKAVDLGLACGKKSAVIFKKGKIIKKIAERDIVRSLVDEIFKTS